MLLGHNRKMTGAECLADMLKGYGVTHVFHVPAVLRRTFAEMERRTDIKRLHVHGEKAAAYMADGYARASGKPGICMAQVIGALNLAAGLRDAWLAHSPVIAMTGGREPKTKFRKVYQEIDDVPAFEPVTKFNATVDDVARFPDMVRQAFRVGDLGHARAGAPAVPRQRGPGRRRGGRDGALVRAAVRAGAAVPSGARRRQRDGGAQGAAGRRAAGDRRRRRRARIRRAAELVALAEALQIPVATSLNGKDAIPGTHPLAVGRGRHLFARERQPGGQRRRSCLLHRLRDRRHDHAFLGGAEDRHAGDPDRHRSRRRSAATIRSRPAVNGDAKVVLARMLALADRGSAGKRKAWVEQAQNDLQGVVRQVQRRADLRGGADPARAHLRRAHPPRARQRHRGL